MAVYCRNLETKQTAKQKSNQKQTEQNQEEKNLVAICLLKSFYERTFLLQYMGDGNLFCFKAKLHIGIV